MENSPIVTIIIPTFNDEKTIKRCITSILLQTERRFEILVINDGSTDDTGLVLELMSFKDKRLNVINQKNSGSGISRNKGILLSKGEFIIFIDADDWVEKNYVSSLLNEIIDKKADIVYCGSRIYKGNHLVSIERNSVEFTNDKNTIKEIFISNYVSGTAHGPISKIYRTSILKDNQIFFPDLRRSQDIVFNLEYAKHINVVSGTNLTFYNISISDHKKKIKIKNDYNHENALLNYDKIIERIINEAERLLEYWNISENSYLSKTSRAHFKIIIDHLYSLSNYNRKTYYLGYNRLLNNEALIKYIKNHKFNHFDIVYRYLIIKKYKNTLYLLLVIRKIVSKIRNIINVLYNRKGKKI